MSVEIYRCIGTYICQFRYIGETKCACVYKYIHIAIYIYIYIYEDY